SLRGGGIERAEVDGIARGTLGHHRIDFDVPTTAALPGPFTIGALLDRNLVGGRADLAATLGFTVTIGPTKHRLDQLVIREPLAMLLGSERVHPAPQVVSLR